MQNKRVTIPLDVAVERLKQMHGPAQDQYLKYLTDNFRVSDDGFIPTAQPERPRLLKLVDRVKSGVARLTPYALPFTLVLAGIAGAQDYQSVRDLRCIHYGANDYRNPCRVVVEEPVQPYIIVVAPPERPPARQHRETLRELHRRNHSNAKQGGGR